MDRALLDKVDLAHKVHGPALVLAGQVCLNLGQVGGIKTAALAQTCFWTRLTSEESAMILGSASAISARSSMRCCLHMAHLICLLMSMKDILEQLVALDGLLGVAQVLGDGGCNALDVSIVV